MKKIVLLVVFVFSTSFAYTQCQSGNCYNGFGTMKYKDGTYQGEFKSSMPNGLGLFFYTDGNYYFGEFLSGKITGKGAYYSKTGENFFGEWLNLKQNGLGIIRDLNGKAKSASVYSNGILTTSINDIASTNNPPNCNGNCYDGFGYIKNPKEESYVQAIYKNGEAVFGRIANSLSTYDGYISNNLPNGYGQIKFTNGEHYFGYFKDGKKHGRGISSDAKNKRTFGEWNQGLFIDKTILEFKQKDFCNELIDLAKLDKDGRKKLKTITGSYNNEALEKKFLNQFEIKYKSSYSSDELIIINFPSKSKQKPTLSMDQLRETTKKCTELINSKGINDFTYKKKFIQVDYILSPVLKIKYPIINPCIAGNCINGYGKKQYHDGIFEGYFKLGERTGYGKMKFTNGKQYEGDYKYDKRNGKGTFTFSNGKKIEGIWVNNSANGPGKEYDKDGNLVFEGEFKKGRPVK